jgi:predicted CoA-binding protein
MMETSVRVLIEDFLSYRRIAMVGVSRRPNDFSRVLFRELQSRGYEMIPVNPHAEEMEGQRCYARVREISPPPDGVLLMTPGSESESVVEECASAGVPRIWMYRATGQGAASAAALTLAQRRGIAVVPGECPFMFLAGGNWIHGAHRVCRKLMGTFPA